jgi:hypothetical protein
VTEFYSRVMAAVIAIVGEEKPTKKKDKRALSF